jgi:hypothetical protein
MLQHSRAAHCRFSAHRQSIPGPAQSDLDAVANPAFVAENNLGRFRQMSNPGAAGILAQILAVVPRLSQRRATGALRHLAFGDSSQAVLVRDAVGGEMVKRRDAFLPSAHRK